MLDEIVADKKQAVERSKNALPLPALEKLIARQDEPRDLARALEGGHTRIIAEVKKASPSRGVLCPDFQPVEIARQYAQGGAAAISVLTEESYFQGRIDYLAQVRDEVPLPILRKDFIFDPYQVYESRAYGADALLLIAAVLEQERLEELLDLSHGLGLKCLVETHSQEEVERAVSSGVQLIGINNRDLADFTIDLETTRRLLPLVPPGRIVVSESGITTRHDVDRLRGWGVNAILVGEALVTADDIIAKTKEMII